MRNRRRGRRINRWVAAILAALAMTGASLGSAPIDPAAASPVTAALAPADQGREPCGKVGGMIWLSSAFALTFVPPVSLANPLVLSGYLGYIGFQARCYQFAPNGSKVTMLTMDYLMSEIEKATGQQLAQARLDSILARAGDLYTTLEREKTNLDHVNELTASERDRLATIMQSLGNDASLLEAEFDTLGWQSLPGVALVAGLKNAAFAMSYALSDDGVYRRHLEMVVFPEERDESIDRLALKEAGLVRFVTDDLTTSRKWSKKSSSGQLFPTTWFEISASAKRGGGYLYQREWKCERRWRPNKECTDFESLRREYFNAAGSAHAKARSEVAEVLDPGYLAVKNALSMYRGGSFSLMNNRVDRSTSQVVLEGKCLDVLTSVATPPPGSPVQQSTCERGAATVGSSDQVWRFIRGTGQVENVRTGLCLGVQGLPADQVNGSPVIVEGCQAIDATSPGQSDQEWGMHPLGYLLNLGSGRCLDMVGTGTIANGAQAQVSTCHYTRSAGTANSLTQPARGASTGDLPDDLATDQTWTMWYVGESLPGSRALPAPPPSRTLPVAVADSVTVDQDSSPTRVEVLANDPVPVGDPKTVQSVTDPAHGLAETVGGGAAVQYTPDHGYCNDRGGGSADTFRYTLNGGSTTTVSVTVRCADAEPVAVTDATTVAQDAPASRIDVLRNDTDVDGGPKRVVAVSDPQHGTALVIEDGAAVSYRPDPGYCSGPAAAPDSGFSYTLNGGSTATVAVTVTCSDTAAPDTEITTKANLFGQIVFRSRTGTVAYRSTEPGSTFECRMDGGPFLPCVSPSQHTVARGRHTFEVRARDAAGNVDPTPARRIVVCHASR